MIAANNVTLRVGKKALFEDVNIKFTEGNCYGMIGANGAGKSTTIRLILDMVQRDGGTVTILGRDSRTASVRTKEEIGVVLGSEGIPLCLNAVQAGKVMAGIYRNWDAAAYAELCQKFGLPDKKQYKDYSTGMKMKLCIAVALAHHPKLLLLDEATSGLDPVARDELIDLLNPGGRFCIITFHSLEDRIVKNAFRRNENPCTCPPEFPVCVCGKVSKGKVITRKPILPSVEELEVNSRSKSAKLRVFEKK